MAVTGSDITAAPRRASARTMSRSLAIPSTAAPSCETTTAPIRCSSRTARRRRTLVSGVTVTTWVPLTRRTSLIRIGPPRHQYAADRVPVPVPAGGRLQSWRRQLTGWRLTAVTWAPLGDPDGSAGGEINEAPRLCPISILRRAARYPPTTSITCWRSGTGVGWGHRARGSPGLPGGAPESIDWRGLLAPMLHTGRGLSRGDEEQSCRISP